MKRLLLWGALFYAALANDASAQNALVWHADPPDIGGESELVVPEAPGPIGEEYVDEGYVDDGYADDKWMADVGILGGDCDSCGLEVCGCSPTWYAGAAMPWLQVNDAGLIIPGTPIMTPHYGQEPSLRIFAGRENCEGLGFRTTYFDFEDSANPVPVGPVTFSTGTGMYAIDLELTQRTQFCAWDLLMSGGVRIGGIKQNIFFTDGVDTLDVARNFHGAGLTIAMEVERSLRCNLSAYGSFRGSLLYGDADVDLLLTAGIQGGPLAATVATIPNQTVAIWEMQMGLEHRKELSCGTLVTRAGVEGQLWEQPPVLLGLLDDNVGLFGPTFSVALER